MVTHELELRMTKAASARDARNCVARCPRLLNSDFLFARIGQTGFAGLKIQSHSRSAHITG